MNYSDIEDIVDFLKQGGILALFFCALMAGVFLCVAGSTYFLGSVPVVCVVDGKEVFRGRSACIDVESSGANTTVSIHKGFLCAFPGAYYVSNDVVLKGDSR